VLSEHCVVGHGAGLLHHIVQGLVRLDCSRHDWFESVVLGLVRKEDAVVANIGHNEALLNQVTQDCWHNWLTFGVIQGFDNRMVGSGGLDVLLLLYIIHFAVQELRPIQNRKLAVGQESTLEEQGWPFATTGGIREWGVSLAHLAIYSLLDVLLRGIEHSFIALKNVRAVNDRIMNGLCVESCTLLAATVGELACVYMMHSSSPWLTKVGRCVLLQENCSTADQRALAHKG
jgi:hypothetical protein